MQSDARSLAARPRDTGLLAAFWALGIFALCLALDTRANTFPFFYHLDEPDKVDQLLGGQWNFHHPPLMLAAAKVVMAAFGVAPVAQDVVVAGRWVSAAFAALSVAAFSLLAYRLRGFAAAVTVGLLLAANHQIFELAHYLKEDTALLAGVSLSLLAAAIFHRKPSVANAFFLGAACALAASGKYIGTVTLALALPVLMACPRERRAAAWGGFVAALLLTLVVVNFPLLKNLATFRASLGREMTLVVGGQHGGGSLAPQGTYWKAFVDNVTPALWPFLVLGYARLWRTRRERTLPEWLLAIFPVAYAILLSFSPKTNDRYFLPPTAAFVCMAGFGVVDAAAWLTVFFPGLKETRGLALTLCAAAALFAETPGFIRYWRAFHHDDRAEMIAWIKANLPPDAVILQENRVLLPAPDNKRWTQAGVLPQKITSAKFASDDARTPDELRRRGFTHVIVSESDYGRFFRRGATGGESNAARKFYDQLHAAPALWKRPRSAVIYLHPGLEIYSLDGPSSEK